jgi:hypothetical protein
MRQSTVAPELENARGSPRNATLPTGRGIVVRVQRNVTRAAEFRRIGLKLAMGL